MDIKRLTIFYAAALKAEMSKQPRGMRLKLATEAGVSPSLITDIVSGRKYGSEESRRQIVVSLGWDYEEFLRYGECLVDGHKYQRAEHMEPKYDPSLYIEVPFYNGIKKIATPEGTICVPDPTNTQPPLVLLNQTIVQYTKNMQLSAFSVLGDNMAPTVCKNSMVIVDCDQRDCLDDGIFLLAEDDGGQYSINRIRRNGSHVFLTNDNRAFTPELLENDWTEIVAGRVVCIYCSAIFNWIRRDEIVQ